MSFSSFVIVCVVALIGYYAYLILKPKKTGFSYSEGSNPFKPTDITIEPPILVTTEMVSYSPANQINSITPPKPATEQGNKKNKAPHTNKYDKNSNVSNSSISKDEISLYLTADILNQSNALWNGVKIA